MSSAERLSFYLEMAKISKAAYAGPINHRLYKYAGQPFEVQKIVHGSFGRGYCRIFWNDSSVAIAFRGTRESVDWTIANFKAFPVALRDCDVRALDRFFEALPSDGDVDHNPWDEWR